MSDHYTAQLQLQKEVKSNPKQPSCKKSVQPQKDHCEKRSEIQHGSQDGRLMAKFLIMTIQVNLVPNPSEMWRRQHKIHLNSR